MANSITQDMRFRESLIKYSKKYGVTKAAIRYKTNRQFIYYWIRRYDGTLESLRKKSTKPHSHPNQHTKQEITLITNMKRRNPKDGLLILWVKLRRKGYIRSYSSLYRILKRLGYYSTTITKKKYTPKPYTQMTFPGERIQIDVKYVPKHCLQGELFGKKLYQYTAIDEYSRLRYLEYFEEKSTYSSTQFLRNCIEYFPFNILSVRTDNGFEFTNRLSKHGIPSLFEQTLSSLNIHYSPTKPYTPRHNGKVERSHRKDNERFYSFKVFISFKDACNQLKKYLKDYNNFPMKPLNWLSPREYLNEYSKNI